MRRFLCEPLPTAAQPATLSAAVSHHMLRVVGIAPGESVVLFDGKGRACHAALRSVSNGQAVLDFVKDCATLPRPERWLLVGVTRGPAFDLTVRMATELGVDRIIPLLLHRSVAKGDRSQRWQRIAASAAAQCGRNTLPIIDAPMGLSNALECLPSTLARRIALPGAAPAQSVSGGAALLLGPEGGLTDKEIHLAMEADFQPIGLGPLVLRADTAAAVGLACLMTGEQP